MNILNELLNYIDEKEKINEYFNELSDEKK